VIEKLMYSTAEAAEALGVSTRTIARWVKDGRIKAVRAGGRLWRISIEEIRRVAEEGTSAPDEPEAPRTVAQALDRIADK